MLYDLNEKNIYVNKKSMIELFANNVFENDLKNKKSIIKSFFDRFIVHSNIMIRIVTIYFENDTFQKIIQIKRDKLKIFFANIIKNEIRLKLKIVKLKTNFYELKTNYMY